MRLTATEARGPFGLVIGLSGLCALVAIFLPRSGAVDGGHVAGVAGWSGGFGVAGALLLMGATGLFVMAGLPTVPRLRSMASRGALAISAVAAAVVTIRIVSIPRGAAAVAGTVVHYGPQIGIWVMLIACIAQLACLVAFVGLRRQAGQRLDGQFLLSLATIHHATWDLDRALGAGTVRAQATLGDPASGLLVACSDVRSRLREQRPQGGSERGWAELGAAAGAFHNAAVLFRSLDEAGALAQYAARAEACRSMLAQGHDHLQRYLDHRDRGRRDRY